MSLAYYIVLDVEDPGFEIFVNGKAIANALDDLDILCQQLKLPVLDSFIGLGLSDLQDFFDEGLEFPEDDNVEGKWFAAQEGITLVSSLLSALKKNPSVVKDSSAVIDDFQEYLDVLEQAKGINAKWHLALDF